LRERKVYVIEETRQRHIKAINTATDISRIHQFDSNSARELIEETEAAELVADLQQQLVMNSPVADRYRS
jgi:hypothetical protein